MSKCDRPGGGSPPTKKSKKNPVRYMFYVLSVKRMLGRTVLNVNAALNGSIGHVQVYPKNSMKFLLTLHMFFCSGCWPRVTIALKIFNDIQHKQKALDDKVKQLEEKLNSTFSSLSTDLGTVAVTASNQTLNN